MLFDPGVIRFWEGRWQPRYVEPMRCLYETELVYVSYGEYVLQYGSDSCRVRAGDVFILPPGMWHESRCGRRGDVVRHCVHFEWMPAEVSRYGKPYEVFVGQNFDKTRMCRVPDGIAQRLPLFSHVNPGDSLYGIIEMLLQNLRQGNSAGERLLWPVVSILLDPPEKNERTAPRHRRNTEQAAVVVRDYIDLHYREAHGYDTYVKLTGMSASSLCQAFRHVYGQTPSAYLSDVRLSQAYRLLSDNPGMPVCRAARAVGITDPNYFARIFKRRFGTPPSTIGGQAYSS